MSLPHDGHRPFFPFGNPLRMIISKGSYVSPKLLNLLNSFEEALTNRLKKLKPKDKEENFLSLTWMKLAVEFLCETHADIKVLITDLQFPISDWDAKWMDMYLDSSVKLLDVCIAFSSELSLLNQGQLLLQYAVHVLDFSKGRPSIEQLDQAHSSLHDWMQQISSRSPKREGCHDLLHGFTTSLFVDKAKISAKGKVLMRAMYAVKVNTIFICSVLTAALTGSVKQIVDQHVSEKIQWSGPFNELQAHVNRQLKCRSLPGGIIALKELEMVQESVRKLYNATDSNHSEDMPTLQNCLLAVSERAEELTQGIDTLSDRVESFFQVVLTGRDALLSNLRISDVKENSSPKEQLVR